MKVFLLFTISFWLLLGSGLIAQNRVQQNIYLSAKLGAFIDLGTETNVTSIGKGQTIPNLKFHSFGICIGGIV